MRRIDAPMAFADYRFKDIRRFVIPHRIDKNDIPVRIVRESDYRRLVKLRQEVAAMKAGGSYVPAAVLAALDALNAKPKERKA